jgi:hypothetical protein
VWASIREVPRALQILAAIAEASDGTPLSMSWLTAFVGRISPSRVNQETGILTRYRQLRHELLPGSSIVVRTNNTGEPFIQECANCGSLDLEVGEWLGEAFRCRDCKVVLLPGENGSVAVLQTAWSRPTLGGD